MKILIIHFHFPNDRNTIYEHLYSFKNYSTHRCIYIDTSRKIPDIIKKIYFDVIIYHYTFLSLKFSGIKFFEDFLKKQPILKHLHGYKIAFPQDEYTNTIASCDFFKKYKIKTIFSCLPESEWQKVYPYSKSGVRNFVQVFPGYIDENVLSKIKNIPHSQRSIDIGYRARKVPYWLGHQGLKKWEITERFRAILKKSTLKFNLSNKYSKVFYGKLWYKFLSNCRCVLGSEGGASLHDPKGIIRQKVDKYIIKHPRATFNKVKDLFFKKKDGNLKLFSISPRHFDACMTKTCQILVEGSYGNVFSPNKHFIKIKNDYSNIKEVIAKIENVKYCEQIAENAFNDIVLSNKYTYRVFVKKVIQYIQPKIKVHKGSLRQNFYIFQYYVFINLWNFGRLLILLFIKLIKISRLQDLDERIRNSRKRLIILFFRIREYFNIN